MAAVTMGEIARPLLGYQSRRLNEVGRTSLLVVLDNGLGKWSILGLSLLVGLELTYVTCIIGGGYLRHRSILRVEEGRQWIEQECYKGHGNFLKRLLVSLLVSLQNLLFELFKHTSSLLS